MTHRSAQVLTYLLRFWGPAPDMFQLFPALAKRTLICRTDLRAALSLHVRDACQILLSGCCSCPLVRVDLYGIRSICLPVISCNEPNPRLLEPYQSLDDHPNVNVVLSATEIKHGATPPQNFSFVATPKWPRWNGNSSPKNECSFAGLHGAHTIPTGTPWISVSSGLNLLPTSLFR